MILNDSQTYFIKCALDLQNHVIDFECEDFEEITGYTVEEMRESLKELRKKL